MEDEKICKIFNTYFTNVTKGLKLPQVDKTVSLENEESSRVIKEHFGNGNFSFTPNLGNFSPHRPFGLPPLISQKW